MLHKSSYHVRCTAPTRTQREALDATVRVYRDAVSFLIKVASAHWECLSLQKGNGKVNCVERLVHATKDNPAPLHKDFDERFYKLPAYIRRAAIADALGKVASWKANYANWEAAGGLGNPPKLSFSHYSFPTLYKPSMFIWDAGGYVCKAKVFYRNDWVWMDFSLKKGDVDYIEHHLAEAKTSNPTLERRGKVWSLRFFFEREVDLTDTPGAGARICAVDLGINTHAVCSIMEPDGTIIGRRFIDFPIDKDRLSTALNRVRKDQQHGNAKTPRLWALANNINRGIARKVACAVVDLAIEYSCEYVVMEHLDMQGRIRGGRKQRIAMWRKREIARIVEGKAHAFGMRFSTVCAWNTSKLAFDGSGRVLRGREILPRCGSFNAQTCMFTSGKLYNADLNASYNIGARFFIRETLKSLPETERLALEAKVPSLAKRTTCTLSSLISLRAELGGAIAA